MKIRPGNPKAHRVVDGDTPHGAFEYVAFESFEDGVIIDNRGRQVGTASMQIRSPAPGSDGRVAGPETADKAAHAAAARYAALPRDAASAATVGQRQAACEACEQYDFGRCEKAPGCGGGGSLWLTVRRASATCPDEKWGAVDEDGTVDPFMATRQIERLFLQQPIWQARGDELRPVEVKDPKTGEQRTLHIPVKGGDE